MKKLLIIQPSIAPYRIDIINSLSDLFETDIFLYNENVLSQSFNLTWINSMLKNTPKLMTEKYKFGKLNIPKGYFSQIRKFKPDYILSTECGIYTIIALLYKFVFNRKTKVISLIDDNYKMVIGQAGLSKKHKLGVDILGHLLDNIVCVEPMVENIFRQRFDKGVYFPIICDDKRLREIYERVIPLSNEYIKKLNLTNKKVILFVGRLSPEKNILSAINAFINAKIKNAIFVIVGAGPDENRIKKACETYDNIILTGRLEGDALYAWYNVAQIFILPSKFEPFGAVTNEALLAGCFCLISSVAGSQCLIDDNNNGFLINPNKIEDMIAKIEMAFGKVKPLNSTIELKPSYMIENYNDCFNTMKKRIFT